MDRRLDKRYLAGAVSAMEKQYGVEKTAAIIGNVWRRYAEIVDENDDEPKKMYMHTRKRIYPAIAAFDAMTGNGISREEAAAFLNRYYEKRAAGVSAKIRGAMRVPGLYRLMPKFFDKMTKAPLERTAVFGLIGYERSKRKCASTCWTAPIRIPV